MVNVNERVWTTEAYPTHALVRVWVCACLYIYMDNKGQAEGPLHVNRRFTKQTFTVLWVLNCLVSCLLRICTK
jgi:hypothetical protein